MSDSRELPSVLLIASDTVGPNMAGTGIRYWNLARAIGQSQPVTLATPEYPTIEPPAGVELDSYAGADTDQRGHRLAELVAAHDVVVAQHIPYLYTDDAILRERFLIVDLYAPWILEKLEHARVDPDVGEPNRKDDVATLNRLLRVGDAFICASERQRDFWLGALAAAGRLDLAQAQADADLRRLIDIVPFGIPSEPPIANGPGPRQIVDGIDENSILILWNGGIWNWLDPLTAIRSMALVAEREPRARLIFMGVRSPVADLARMRVVDDAQSLANDLDLLDRIVFFNDWVPYDQRQNWLLQADLGLSLHLDSLESRFAYRTRMLDNIWCGLPIVATDGDVLADLIQREEIGLTVPPGDHEAVAQAILAAIEPGSQRVFRDNLTRQAPNHTWDRVTVPLVTWCRNPINIGERIADPHETYVRNLERTYTETAQYARRLEQVVGEKNRQIESQQITVRNLAKLALNRVKQAARQNRQ